MQRDLFQGQLSLGHAAVMHDQSVIPVTTPLETRWRCIMFIFLTNICLLLDAAIFEEITRRHRRTGLLHGAQSFHGALVAAIRGNGKAQLFLEAWRPLLSLI